MSLGRTAAPAVTLLLFGGALTVAPTGGGAPPPSATRHVVEIRGFRFEPAELEVAVGDTVVWINRDAAPHTATATRDGAWDSGGLAAGKSFTRVIASPDEDAYHCTYHPGMTAVVEALPRKGGT